MKGVNMSEQAQSNQILVVNSELSKHVISEFDLLRVLNMEQSTLNVLRYHGDFPVVYLNQRNRVYLIKDLLAYLESRRGYIQRKATKRSEA